VFNPDRKDTHWGAEGEGNDRAAADFVSSLQQLFVPLMEQDF